MNDEWDERKGVDGRNRRKGRTGEENGDIGRGAKEKQKIEEYSIIYNT
jgi:hypothetical protein